MPQSKNQKKKTEFATGLLMGFLLGSTSYFLLNTKEGRELQNSFKDKWQTVQKEMPAVSEFTIGDLKLKEIINVLLGIDVIKKKRREKTIVIKDAKRRHSGIKPKQPQKFKGLEKE